MRTKKAKFDPIQDCQNRIDEAESKLNKINQWHFDNTDTDNLIPDWATNDRKFALYTQLENLASELAERKERGW